MECPHVVEIVDRMLSPELAPMLRWYAKRLEGDPRFMQLYPSASVLELRRLVGLPFAPTSFCWECPRNSVTECCIQEPLRIACRVRMGTDAEVEG